MSIHPVDAVAVAAIMRAFKSAMEDVLGDYEQREKFFNGRLRLVEPVISEMWDEVGAPRLDWNSDGGPWTYLEIKLTSDAEMVERWLDEREAHEGLRAAYQVIEEDRARRRRLRVDELPSCGDDE